MKNPVKIAGVIAALSFAAPLFADVPGFTYVEAGYVRANPQDLDINPDGFALSGSYAFNASTFARGAYVNTEDDLDGVNIEADSFSLGLGYRQVVSATSVWYLVADYVEVDGEVSDGNLSVSADENGYALGTGIRTMLNPKFELAFEINYVDIEEADGFAGSIGAVYSVTPEVGLTASAGIDEDDNSTAGVGIRYTF